LLGQQNLACIMIVPRQQGKRLGLLLVELSYELSRRSGLIGSPERPLSVKGESIYASFWISRVWYFLQEVFRGLQFSLANEQLISVEGLKTKDHDETIG